MKQYAVITGASSGIGMEFAKQLSKQGYSLILIARRKNRMLKLAEYLQTQCEIISADLTDIKECKRVYEEIKSKEIAIFINNAGFGDCGSFLESDFEKELQMLQLNILAVQFFQKKILQKMRKKDAGYLLNVASTAGLLPAGPYMATYYASKSYIVSLTRAVSAELKNSKSHVYIGCLCPGPVNTEFNRVANVEFSLKGISPQYCVKYALKQMKKHKTVIVPTTYMKLAVFFGRFFPVSLCIRIVAHQQQKKMYK